MQIKKRLSILLGAAIPALVIDRITKFWAANWLIVQDKGSAPCWPGVFGFVYAENTGMAFSFLSGSTAFLAAFSLILVLGVSAYTLLAKEMSPALAAGLSFIAAGGAGNLWDRLFYGYVIDFIHLEFMRFAIFNIADICVCCGAALVICILLISDLRTKKETKK